LANGREVLVRPVRPEDAGPLRAGLSLLEPPRLRMRLAGGTELGPIEAERLTRMNPRLGFMLVACDPEPPGEAVIAALGHVRTDAAGHLGEFVVLVSPFVRGMGMGRYLLTRIVKWARGRGIDILRGDIAADDQPMLELAASMGFRRTEESDDPAFVRLVLTATPA
jgi:GNAT superfamily N-acetyltransferase